MSTKRLVMMAYYPLKLNDVSYCNILNVGEPCFDSHITIGLEQPIVVFGNESLKLTYTLYNTVSLMIYEPVVYCFQVSKLF